MTPDIKSIITRFKPPRKLFIIKGILYRLYSRKAFIVNFTRSFFQRFFVGIYNK